MKILGTGACLGDLTITNEKIETFGHKNAEWTEKMLGIKERRVDFRRSPDLGAEAAKMAIKDAGLEPMDISMLIVATSTPGRLNPSAACVIQDRIGAYNAVSFDINAVCSGFVYALDIANHYYGNILVIGVDTFSHITDWTSRDCVFFGDGAGAVILARSISDDKFYSVLGSDGSGQNAFYTEYESTFEMDGKAVYKAGTTILPEIITKVLVKANIKIDDIQCMLPHQASINMLKELAKKIGLPWEKVKTNMDRYGNTAAASIPILLHESKGDFKKGDHILMAAIGSGWTYGAIIIEW